jgi:F0F1-type ATP synthase gamma subunit
MQRKTRALGQGNKTIVVQITYDRGLCGGINFGIVREVKYRITH